MIIIPLPKRRSVLLLLFLGMNMFIRPGVAGAQSGPAVFTSSDTALQLAFERARDMALSYRGSPSDPVGPWYEAALPSRNAFCVRDVSHQLIGAEVLGMHAENRNMLTHFVSGISESKDWCTFWEINKSGGPAPEDYRNDKEFWYNLNANYELIHASWRMFLWTGDSTYITTPVFRRFFDLTVTKFAERWHLSPETLLKRPVHPNAPVPFQSNDYFHRCRGLPSYYEAIADIGMGVDLVAAMYRGLSSYAAMAEWSGDGKKAATWRGLADSYRRHMEMQWWDDSAGLYNTFYTHAGKFGKGEGETYLLWYDALTDSSRACRTIGHLAGSKWNVENLSYLSYQMSRYGYFDNAYRYILFLTDPATARREYPEVSFGVMEGIVQGIMGVEPDARHQRLTTVYNSHSPHFCAIRGLKVLSSEISLKHAPGYSELTNDGKQSINWRAAFNGRIPAITVNGKRKKSMVETDFMGNQRSWVAIRVAPGATVKAAIAR